MAALGGNFIRVRVHFDYPPPAVVDCRMCWLLVDLNTCRVVADLESIIRDKFGFGRRSILNLFIEDCYLPHTESVYVVRDNDSVRVKVDSLPQVNGGSIHPDPSRETCRKRQRPAEGDELGPLGASEELKKKKRKKGSEENVENEAKQKSSDESKKKKSGGAENDKKKKKKVEGTEPEAKKTPAKVVQLVQNKPKTPQTRTHRNVSSSDSSSSSSSEEDAAAKKAQKPAPKPPTSAPAASKAPQKKRQPPPSSSSSSASSSSSDDEAASTSQTLQNKPQTAAESRSGSKPKPPPTAPPPPLRPVDATRPASESEEEITLVIKQPKHPPGFGFSQTSGAQAPWRGRGRGMSGRGGAGPRGRGDSRGGFRANGGGGGGFETSFNGAMEPSYETDSLTNTSVVLQNAPRPDYSSMPLLAAPPQVGQKIAFKLLELTENYTPEVSEYKEATILSFDHSSRQVELELQSSCQAPAEPGKFDLVYQNPDGSERVEYAVSRSSRVNELWDSLLEPRLII